MKYKLTEETATKFRRIIHRIQALKDFGNVKKGALVGFIESQINLSQDGTAWVADNVIVEGKEAELMRRYFAR